MSTASKWLLGVVVVLNLGLFYLSAQVLGAYRDVRGKVNTLESQHAQETARTKQLKHGSPETPGILELRNQLHAVVTRRGRAWYNVAPTVGREEQTGALWIRVELPAPFVPSSPEATQGVLFAFEQDGQLGAAGGGAPAETVPVDGASPADESAPAVEAVPGAARRYVGEFRIVSVEGNSVTLTPALFLSKREQNALLGSQGPWTVYDVLPLDSHAALAGLDESQVSEMLHVGQREGSVREALDAAARDFLRDGTPTVADDPPDRIVEVNGERIYRRKLKDFGYLLRELDRQRTTLLDQLAAVTAEIGFLKSALDDADRQEKYHNDEKAQLAQDRERLTREMAAVNNHREGLAKSLSETQAGIDKLLGENRSLAEELTLAQLSALRKADEASYEDGSAPESAPMDEALPAPAAPQP